MKNFVNLRTALIRLIVSLAIMYLVVELVKWL